MPNYPKMGTIIELFKTLLRYKKYSRQLTEYFSFDRLFNFKYELEMLIKYYPFSDTLRHFRKKRLLRFDSYKHICINISIVIQYPKLTLSQDIYYLCKQFSIRPHFLQRSIIRSRTVCSYFECLGVSATPGCIFIS